MPIIYPPSDSDFGDRVRRLSLFEGDFFVYRPRPASHGLCELARSSLEQMLGSEPPFAQQRMSEPEFAVLFRGAARNFHLRGAATRLASALAVDLGCDSHSTFLSEPSLTAITGSGFLAHGTGSPQHPHRDTWYAASVSQVTWWLPLYDLGTSSIAFHPQYWDIPVVNSSRDFDYDEWSRQCKDLEASLAGPPFFHLLKEPRPLDTLVLTPDIRIASPTDGIALSSCAHLYSVVPNDSAETYFGTVFHTVNENDLLLGAGAMNLDAEPRGTMLATFVRCDDFSPIPQELVDRELQRRSEAVIPPPRDRPSSTSLITS